MKKVFFLSMLVGLLCVSCESKQPEVSFQGESPLCMVIEDSTVIQVSAAKSVVYGYSKSRNESSPVFSASNEFGASTTIHALHPGTDTLFVNAVWNAGIYTYGKCERVIVKVQ